MVKKFNVHKKRGQKRLTSYREESQGKGQWSKKSPFFTDEKKRVRKVDSTLNLSEAKKAIVEDKKPEAPVSHRGNKGKVNRVAGVILWTNEAEQWNNAYFDKALVGEHIVVANKSIYSIREITRISQPSNGLSGVCHTRTITKFRSFEKALDYANDLNIRHGKSKRVLSKISNKPSKYRSIAYGSAEITFRDDGKGNVLASVDDRKDVAKGKDYNEALRNAKKVVNCDYELENNITKTNRKFKSKATPLKVLEQRDKQMWEEALKAEKEAEKRGVHDYSELLKVRAKVIDEWHKKHPKPDLNPLVWRVTIGHYGGLHVDVPEEKYDEFKSLWSPREFPKKVRTVDVRLDKNSEGEWQFRQKFPNSNRIKEVYFAHGTRGERRLDFMDVPRSS